MAEDHKRAWDAVEAEHKARRAENRARNTKMLQDAGIAFTILDNGAHLRIEHQGHTIDFMPGPGTWSIRGQRGNGYGQRHGARSLIQYLNTSEGTSE